MASYDLGAVMRAAFAGRVSDLFVAADCERWGRCTAAGAVHLHDQRLSSNDDVLNIAIIQTLAAAGAVHVLPQSEIPGKGAIAAAFRY